MENSIAAEQEADHLAEFHGEDSNSDTSQPELDLEKSDSCSTNLDEAELKQPEINRTIHSKDKKVLFSQTPYPTSCYTQQNIFRANPGPKNFSGLSTPGQFLKLFVDTDMTRKCVEFTNLFGKSIDQTFQQIDTNEFYKFVGLGIFIGIFTAKQENFGGNVE
ncbi:MAG: hypothetical protein MHMPM18_003761 [Marteilia pararefringens]